MPVLSALRRPRPATAWGSPLSVQCTEPSALPVLRELARRHLGDVERTCSRDVPDAEVHALARAGGRPVRVSGRLLRQVQLALDAASATEGRFDPTVGRAVASAGLRTAFPLCGNGYATRPGRGWRCVEVVRDTVRLSGGGSLDLRASALAAALDDVALAGHQLTGAGVLVRCGDRVATSGVAPAGRWTVRLGDTMLGLEAGEGASLLTSRSVIIDPASGAPAPHLWRSVLVVAASCHLASTTAVAAATGADAHAWLAARDVRAALVDAGAPVRAA